MRQGDFNNGRNNFVETFFSCYFMNLLWDVGNNQAHFFLLTAFSRDLED